MFLWLLSIFAFLYFACKLKMSFAFTYESNTRPLASCFLQASCLALNRAKSTCSNGPNRCLPTLLIPAEYAACDEAVLLFNWLIGFVCLLNGCLRSKRDLDVGFKDTKSFLANSNLRSYLTTAFYNCTTSMANLEDFISSNMKPISFTFVSNFDEVSKY